MADAGILYVKVMPSAQGFGKAMEGQVSGGAQAAAAKAGGAWETSMSGAASAVTKKLGGALSRMGKTGLAAVSGIATSVGGLAASGGIDRALNVASARAKLKGLVNSTQEVDDIMADAMASVKGTAYGFGDAATVAASLSASGVTEGEQLTSVLKTVADTAAISGRSLTDVGAIFGSVAARGKLQGDDMLQLTSAGVPVLQMLSNQLGVTTADVSDMVSKGQIDFQTFADAMQAGLGGSALASGDTFTGAMDNAKAALSRLGEAAATPALDNLKDTLTQLTKLTDQVTNAAKPLIEQVAAQAQPVVDRVNQAIGDLTQGMADGSVSLADIAGAAGKAVAAFGSLAGAGALLSKSGGISKALGGLNVGGGMGAALSEAGASLSAFGSSAGGTLASVATAGKAAMKGLSNSVDTTIMDIWERWPKTLDMTDKAQAALKALPGKAKDGMKGLADAINGSAPGKAVQALSDRLGSIGNAINGSKAGRFTKQVSDTLGKAWGNIGDTLGPVAQSAMGTVWSAAQGTAQTGVKALAAVFNPATMMKTLAFGSIAAAIVAALGALNEQTGGQIENMVRQVAAKAPQVITGFATRLTAALPRLIQSGASLIDTVLQGVNTALPSLVSAVGGIVTSLVTGLSQAAPQILATLGTTLGTLASQILLQAPQMMMAGLQLMLSLAQGLTQGALNMVTTITAQLPAIIQNLAATLTTQLPQLLALGQQVLQGVVDGILAALPVLLDQLPTILTTVMDTLATLLPQLATTALQAIQTLAQGLMDALPTLVEKLPAIIESIVNGLAANLPKIVEAGVQILTTLTTGLIGALPQLIRQLPRIITTIVQVITQNMPAIIQAGIQILTALATGLIQAIPQLVAQIPQIVTAIIDAFAQTDWGQIGRSIMDGLKNGLTGAVDTVVDGVKNVAGSIANGFKDFFGIHSPSRLMAQMGRYLDQGLALGITRGAATPIDAADLMAQRVEQAAAIRPQTILPRGAASLPAAALAGAGGAGTVVNLSYNAYGESLDSERAVTEATVRTRAILMGVGM